MLHLRTLAASGYLSELERDFNAAVALSVLVPGFSFAVILTARFLSRRATGYSG